MSELNGSARYDESPPRSGSFGLLISGFVGLAFLGVLYLVSPFFLYLALAALGMLVVVGLHWILWGRRMTTELKGEREELLRRDAEAERERDNPPPPWERRF
jgi:hypothetical protein